VLPQYIDGSQELLERSLVQNWLALRAGLALHVGGYPEPAKQTPDQRILISALDAPLGRLPSALIPGSSLPQS
jgi:hypothetical protein